MIQMIQMIQMNRHDVDFLDLQFNLKNNLHRPYKQLNNDPTCIFNNFNIFIARSISKFSKRLSKCFKK